MSAVDTQFSESERAAYIAELRVDLAAFIAGGTTEIQAPIDSVSALTGLRTADLRKVALVHLALSDEVRRFADALAQGTRKPISDTVRPVVVSYAVRGGIDWGSTIRNRATAGYPSHLYAVRPAQRAFDTPENRALAWLLDELDARFRSIPSAELNEDVGVYSAQWLDAIGAIRTQLNQARNMYWLRDVTPEPPDHVAIKRLKASRSGFYRIHLQEVLDKYTRFVSSPRPDDLAEFLCDRYFEPQRDWKLFELLVAIRIARRLEQEADSRISTLLVGSGRSPYARLSRADTEIQCWYQSWPSAAAPSSQRRTMERFRISGEATRPDIVIEVAGSGGSVGLLLEIKATKQSAYLSAGVVQALGYLKDRPHIFSWREPVAAVVAPRSRAFSPNSDERDLDVVVLDDEAVVEWVRDQVVAAIAVVNS